MEYTQQRAERALHVQWSCCVRQAQSRPLVPCRVSVSDIQKRYDLLSVILETFGKNTTFAYLGK